MPEDLTKALYHNHDPLPNTFLFYPSANLEAEAQCYEKQWCAHS